MLMTKHLENIGLKYFQLDTHTPQWIRRCITVLRINWYHLIHVQGLEHYSCFTLLFQSLECVTLDTKICRNMVLKKICQPLQWLGTFNEQPAKQIEIQVHIFKNQKSPTVVIQHMCSEVLCTQSVWMMHVFDLHMK